MANRYWIGNSGNWRDTAHWATTSGGTGGASVASYSDNAIFDANSFTATGQTVTIDTSYIQIVSMDWSNVTNNPTLTTSTNATISPNGSVILSPNMNVTLPYQIQLQNAVAGNYNLCNKAFTTVTFAPVSGAIINITGDVAATLGLTLSVNNGGGTINTNNYNLTSGDFLSLGNGATRLLNLNLGSSIITVGGNISGTSDGVTINNGTSKIIMNGTGKNINITNGWTFNTLELQQGSTINGTNTINKLVLTAGKTYSFNASLTINKLSALGSSGNLITINNTFARGINNSGTKAHVWNYCSIKNVTYTGAGATAYNSTNVSGNTGITFSAGNPQVERYWVSGTGNWSDTAHWSDESGGTGGVAVPISTDNVYFDAASFTGSGQTVTVDAVTNCKNMDWTGVTNNPTLSQTSNAYLQYIYGDIVLVSGMSLSGAYAGTFNVRGTASNITTAGKTICLLEMTYLTSVNITLQDNLTLSSYLSLTNGTFNTNNKNITCNVLQTPSTNTKVLNFGSSVITSATTITISTTGTTLNAGTSTLIMQGTGTFAGGGFTYNKVELQNNSTISGSNTFNQIKVSAGKTVTFTDSSTQTVTDLYLNDSVILTAATSANLIYTGTVAPSYTGTGITKTNIILTTPNIVISGKYWIGGTGNWSDVSHWSISSGGGSFLTSSIPSSTDNVYFDANSFSGAGQTVTVDAVANCKSMDWTGATNTPTFTGLSALTLTGSFTLVAGMVYTHSAQINLNSTLTTSTITTNGVTTSSTFWVAGGGSSSKYTLQDNWNNGAGIVSPRNGQFDTNSKNITCGAFIPNGTNTLTLGASIITCGNYSVASTITNFNIGTSTIVCSGSFDGGGKTYNRVSITNTATISSNNTFAELILAPAKTYTFTSGTTQTVSRFGALGTSGNVITIKSSSAGSPATISDTSGVNTLNYASIKDITATGGATFTAYNSTNVSGNTGINFSVGNPVFGRFWTGNGGNWSDTAHWATISGGVSGAAVPTSLDNAIFDANSFTSASQTVTVDSIANCLDMDWTGVTNTPNLAGTATLSIYGSLTLIASMTRTYTGIMYFESSTTGKTITTAGLALSSVMMFGSINAGGWTFQDNVNTGGKNIVLQRGTLDTNGKTVSCGDVRLNYTTARTLTLGSSTITTTSVWDASTTTNFTFNAGTSTIISLGTIEFKGGGLTYNIVELQNSQSISGNNTFNQIKVSASKTITFTNSSTQTVTDLYLNDSVILTAATSANLIYTGTIAPSYTGTGITKTNIILTTPNIVISGKYWIGGTGNWSDISHWSISSGGGSFLTSSIPSSTDNVYFDVNSFNVIGQTVTLNVGGFAKDLDFTGIINTPTFTFNNNINVYGNFKLASDMNVVITSGSIDLGGTDINITSAGKTLPTIYFGNMTGGTFTLQDNLTVNGNIYCNQGTFNTNNNNITTVDFISDSEYSKIINLGSSIITASGDVTLVATNLTFDAGTSTVVMTGSNKTLTGGGQNYFNLQLIGTPITIADNNTIFNKLVLAAGKTLNLTAGSTQTIAFVDALGTNVSNITIQSTSAGNPAIISKISGQLNIKYCSVKDIIATGGATFNAVKSTSVSGNSGINFVDSVSIGQLAPSTPEIAGLVALATAPEAVSGIDVTKAVTPYALAQAISAKIKSGAIMPSASEIYRGQLFLFTGESGVADELYVCRKKADDTYEWLAL